jgi:surface polysaccharide O-acyltransferase-like enzyme
LVRAALAILAVAFAFALGRVGVRLHRNKQPYAKAGTWVLRITLCVFAVFWRWGFDATSIATLALVSAGLALGAFMEQRPRHDEEIHLFRE